MTLSDEDFQKGMVRLQESVARLRDGIVALEHAVRHTTAAFAQLKESDMNDWIKSSFSQGNSNCVEFKRQRGIVSIRDSKNPGVVLGVSLEDAAAFVKGVKNGDFDALLSE